MGGKILEYERRRFLTKANSRDGFWAESLDWQKGIIRDWRKDIVLDWQKDVPKEELKPIWN